LFEPLQQWVKMLFPILFGREADRLLAIYAPKYNVDPHLSQTTRSVLLPPGIDPLRAEATAL